MAVALMLSGCSSEEARDDGAGAAASFPASDVLRGWDAARSRAFAAGDVGSLRRLYVAGSSAGTSDERLLRDYLERGLRVEGMSMQVLALEVLHDDPGRLRLLVTDRLTGAVAVGHGTRLPLPADRASTRVVELRRSATDKAWRVVWVRESERTPAAR